MSGPKHTPWIPGPWGYGVPVKGGRAVVEDANGNVICVVEGGPLRREVTIANAQLIAAAPRLAAALKGLVADIEALMEDTEGVETTDGDGMPYTMNWERMLPGGKYEYLTHWNDARAALREAGASIPPTVES